jgi:hypothetical protein
MAQRCIGQTQAESDEVEEAGETVRHNTGGAERGSSADCTSTATGVTGRELALGGVLEPEIEEEEEEED